MGESPKVPDARQGRDISEPLRRSLESLPLQPSAQMPQALSELKPQVEDELRTLALLERRSHLSDGEHRQERALRDLLALIEETLGDERQA